MNIKNILVSAVTAFIVAILAVLVVGGNNQPQPSLEVGAATPGTRFPHGLTVGSIPPYSPTNLALYEQGTCTLLANYSIAASTTANVDCLIPDAVAGDVVRLQLAASTTLASQYMIKAAAATSTGAVTAQITNLTGATAVPAATNGFGSSTVYQLWRAQ